MTNILSVGEAKAKLSEILNRVREKGDRYIIERRGKPVAAVVPLQDLPLEQRVPADDWLRGLMDLGPDGEALAETLDDIVAERASNLPRDVDLGDD